MHRRLIPIVAALAILVTAAPAPAWAGSGRASARDARQGIVEDGTAATAGPCPRVIALDGLPAGRCSHGPDAAPRSVDVRRRIPTSRLRRLVLGSPIVALTERARTTLVPDVPIDATGVPCIGDGSDGARIVAVYASVRGGPDRYGKVVPLIARIAGGMDAAVALAADRTGGERHLRWLTTDDCALDVRHAVISPAAGRSFTRTIEELRAGGYDEPGRRYLVWTDARTYCGTGLVMPDGAGAASYAADEDPSWARIDQGCWGRIELHELLHALGAVQPDAPHGTTTFHCTDGPDPMCGDAGAGDGGGACPSADALLPDCGADDYFSASPAPGSWLASHRNVADSPYLHGAPEPTPSAVPATPSPTPIATDAPTAAPVATATAAPLPPSSIRAPSPFSGTEPTRTYAVGSAGGPATMTLELVAAVGVSVPVRVRVVGPDGTVLAEIAATLSPAGPRTLTHGLIAPPGIVSWEVTALGVGSYIVRIDAAR